MFTKARIKLTISYLIIIMLISLSFSFIIFQLITNELKRIYIRQEIKLTAQELNIKIPQPMPPMHELQQELSNLELDEELQEEFDEAKQRVIINLIGINFVILIISAISAYFLSGLTLDPIKIVLEKQQNFIADASHDLRTPLAGMKTSIEVTLRDKKSSLKDLKTTLEGNLEDVNRLESITNNLISLAKYEGSQKLETGKIDINEILKNIIKILKVQIQEKNIKINYKPKKILISANKDGIERMLLAIIENAVKYSNQNGDINIQPEKKSGYIFIEISDNGIGIEKNKLDKIFDRFYRAESSRSQSKSKGFGLGLPIAKRIANLHGGDIIVKSEIKKGSTFTIKLPIK